METKLMKTSIRGASVALLVSAGLLLLLVSGIQGSGQRSSVGGFECTDATIRGDWGTQMQGTAPVPPPLGGGIQNVVGVVTRTYDGVGNFTQIDNIHGSVTGWMPNRPGAAPTGERGLHVRDSIRARSGRSRDRGARGDRWARQRITLRHRDSHGDYGVGPQPENDRR